MRAVKSPSRPGAAAAMTATFVVRQITARSIIIETRWSVPDLCLERDRTQLYYNRGALEKKKIPINIIHIPLVNLLK